MSDGHWTQEHPMYREFTDVNFSHWPYVSSEQARQAILALMREHGLGAEHNPGGVEIHSRGGAWHCQITDCDTVYDLGKLRKAIAENPPPTTPEKPQ
jgi:hypothetical protein